MKGSYMYKGNKPARMLNIYERLLAGEVINKTDLAVNFHVDEKTIQRDIDSLRNYLAENYIGNDVTVQYSKSKNGYYLAGAYNDHLTNKEILALCKILLESRAFRKDELDLLINKLLMLVSPSDKKRVNEIIMNERFHYVPLCHDRKLFEPIWELSQSIIEHRIISIEYTRVDGVTRTHEVKPVALMFSEYYFYLVAYLADDRKDYPTIFRVDRIISVVDKKERFHVPYADKFEDGEFRKRVQFMYSGELKTVTFEYSGRSIEAVLDRLPTAEIISVENGVYMVSAETYGDGIYMWLRSQGEMVKVV